MKKLALFLTFLLACSPLQALSLQEAKEQKKICELPTGYVQAKDPSAASLADSVNAARRQEYASIAQKRHISVDEAAKIAAEALAGRGHGC